MPIDDAMAYELAEAWLAPYLDAMSMRASHPLRLDALEAADAQVMESYRNVDTADWDDGLYTAEVLCEQIGQDVAPLLRGVAQFILATHQEPTAQDHQNRTHEGKTR